MIIARQSLQGLLPTLTFEDPAACAGTLRDAVNIFQDGVITYWSCLLNHSLTYPGDLQPLQPKKERLVYLLLVNQRCLNFYNRCFILLKLIGH